MKKYPDIREVIKKKEEYRRSLATLSFEEKIEIVFKLRERQQFVKSGRAISHQQKPKSKRA